MKCENCKSEFKSTKWLSILNTTPSIVVICDKCLKEVFKARIKLYKDMIKDAERKIKELNGGD